MARRAFGIRHRLTALRELIGASTMSNTATIDPSIAAQLGFPKLRYVLVEHERRWLCSTIPTELVRETVEITDLYVDGSNLRLREERFLSGSPPMLRLSRKVDVDASTRLISSIYLQPHEFALLKGALMGKTLRKRRHRLASSDGVVLAVDEFDGPLAGLMTLEAEFSSVDAMRRFEAPWYTGVEVTENAGFGGGGLVTSGIPADFR